MAMCVRVFSFSFISLGQPESQVANPHRHGKWGCFSALAVKLGLPLPCLSVNLQFPARESHGLEKLPPKDPSEGPMRKVGFVAAAFSEGPTKTLSFVIK